MTRSLRAKLPAVIAALFVVWALRGGRPEVVHSPFHSDMPIVLDDLLGRYLSAEQQSEEAIKVIQRGLGSRQLGLSGHHCTAALGMCHGTVQALDLPWTDHAGVVLDRAAADFSEEIDHLLDDHPEPPALTPDGPRANLDDNQGLSPMM